MEGVTKHKQVSGNQGYDGSCAMNIDKLKRTHTHTHSYPTSMHVHA